MCCAGDDQNIQLAAYRARRELAVLENRDPELIAALDKLIAGITNAAQQTTAGSAATTWARFSPQNELTMRELQLLEADTSSLVFSDAADLRKEMEAHVLDDLNNALTTGTNASEVLEIALAHLLNYVDAGYDEDRAEELLEELARHVGLSRRGAYDHKLKFRNALEDRNSGDP